MPVSDVLYLDAELMPLYYDIRRLQQVLSDTGLQLTPTEVTASPLLEQAINSACSDINASCFQGKRYTADMLQTLIQNKSFGVREKMAATLLEQLTADLAFGFIMGRRGYSPDVQEKLAPRLKSALVLLERLYLGEKVFDITEAIEAGVPKIVRIGGNGYLPSAENKMFGIWRDTPGYYGMDSRGRMW